MMAELSTVSPKWGQQPDLRCNNFDLDMSESGRIRAQ